MKHINHKTVFVSLLAFFLMVSFTPPLKKTKKVEEKPIATFLPMGGGIIKSLTSQSVSLSNGKVNAIVSNSSVIQNIQNDRGIDSVARLSTENGMQLNEIIQPITPLPVKPLPLNLKSGLFKLAEKLKSNTNEELASTQREYYKYDSTSKVFEKILTTSGSVEAVGFDPVRFTLSSNKDSVSLGGEIEIKITAEYLDVSPSLMFQFEGSNAFTLKMLLPEGFIQTGGTYYDYIQGKVDKANPKQEFTIKGVFEAQDKEPCFSLLRSFAGAGVNDVWERKVGRCISLYINDNFSSYEINNLSAQIADDCDIKYDNCEKRYIFNDMSIDENSPGACDAVVPFSNNSVGAHCGIDPYLWSRQSSVDSWLTGSSLAGLPGMYVPSPPPGRNFTFDVIVPLDRQGNTRNRVAGFFNQNNGVTEYVESISRTISCPYLPSTLKVKFDAAVGSAPSGSTPLFKIKVGNNESLIPITTTTFEEYGATFSIGSVNSVNVTITVDRNGREYAYLLLDNFRVYEDLGAPSPPTNVIASPDEISSGGSSELSGTCSSGTLTWDDGSTGSPRTVSPTVNTTYWAVCKNSSCASSKAETTVTVRADVATCGGTGIGSFSISVLSNATERQCGVSVGETLYVSGALTDGSSADEYQWYFDNGTTNTLIGTSAFLQITTSATYANSGTYKFLARKGDVWCEKSIQVTICSCGLDFTPSYTATGNASAGTTTLYSNVPNCSNCTYLWTLPNAPNGNGQTLTESNLVLTNEKRVNGTYSVRVKKGDNPDCDITKTLIVDGIQHPSYNGAVLNAFCNNISGDIRDYNNPGLQIPPLTLEIKKQTPSGLVSMPNESIPVTSYGSFSRDWNPAYKDGSVYEVKVRFPAPNGSSMGPYQTSPALIQCCTLALSPTAEPIASCDANTNKGRYVVNLTGHSTTMQLQYRLLKKTFNSSNNGVYLPVNPTWTIIPVGTAVPFLQFTDLERGFYQLEIVEGINLNNQGCKIMTNFTIDCETGVSSQCGTPPLITAIPDQILSEGGTITPTLFAEPIATSNNTSVGLGKVAVLSGTNSIQLGNQDGTNSNTFEAWIKAENNSDITVGYIGAGEKHRKLMQYWGVQHPFVNNLSVGSNGVTLIEDIPGKANARRIAISFNRKMTGWNHIALVYRNHIPEIYINGKLEGKATQSIYTIQNVQAADSYDTQLGYNQNLGFNGSVDEVRLWFSTLGSTSDLTAATISQNLKSRDNVPVIGTGKYWAFDESDPLKNVSGSNYDKLKFEGNVQVRATNASDDKLPQNQDYQWYLNGLNLATGSFYTTLIDQLKPDSQTYVLHYTGDNGVDCHTSKTIKIRRCVSISPNTTQIICEGTPLTLTATGNTGSTFTWYKVGKTTAIATTPTYAVPTSAEGDGIYYAKSSTCNSESERVEVKHIVIAKPTASVTPNPATEGVSSSATFNGNYLGDNGTPPTYLWTGPNNFVSALQNPVLTNLSRATNAGIYTLTITQTDNNLTCNSTATTKLIINAANCGLNFGYDQECVGGLGKITIVVTGNTTGRTMQYSIDNGANWLPSNIFTNLLNGDYDVSVRSYLSTLPPDQITEADYCYMNTQQVTITCAATCSVQKKLNYDRWDNIEGTEINDFTATQLSAVFNLSKSESGFAPNRSGNEPNFDIRNGTTQNFIARMHGSICPPVSGTYTFYMKADNSAKLFINGSQVIWVPDNPNNHNGEVSGTYTFPTANTQATIEVHHKQGISASFVMLSWKVGSSPKVLVSADYLSPTTTTVNPCQDFDFTLTTTPNRIPDKIVEGTEIKAIATATNGNTSGFKWTAVGSAPTIFDAPKGTTGASTRTVVTNIPVYLRPALLSTETGQGPFPRTYKVAFVNAPPTCYQEITLNVIKQTCDCPTNDCDKVEILNPSLVTSFGTSQNFVAETVYLDESASTGMQTVTYFDGLGRPKQKINIHSGPEQQDMVQPMEYDAFGRMPKNFLPYPVIGNNGNWVANATTNVVNWYKNEPGKESSETPFTQSTFEASPLSRPSEQLAIGNDKLANKSVMVYSTNATNEVKMFTVTGSSVAVSTYPANTLYKTQSTEVANIPSGNLVTVEYKDKDGRVVCKDVGGLRTYNVYNDLGQLVCVVQPSISSSITNFTLFASTAVNEQMFQYEYNDRGLMTRKKVPSADAVAMTYYTSGIHTDMLESTIETRNDVRLATKIEYDELNRPLSTSVKIGPETTSDWVEVSHNFYDDYTGLPFGTQADLSKFYLPDGVAPVLNSTGLKGLPTGSWSLLTKNDGTFDNGNKLYTSIFYDNKNRVIQTVNNNHTSTANQDYTSNTLDFVGRAKATFTQITHNTGGGTLKTQTKNGYDYGGRPTGICQKIDKDTYNQKWEPLAAYKYNDIGEMIEKTLGCRTQVVDFEYDIRGWLRKINNPSNLVNTSTKEYDFFGMSLAYTGDGNISGQTYRTAQRTGATYDATPYNISTTTDFSNTYGYDIQKRIRTANLSGNAFDNAGNSNAKSFSVTMGAYDKNGNITSLTRYANGAKVDGLGYNYSTSNPNQLASIVDDGGTADFGKAGTYQYYTDGSLKVDGGKGISNFTYAANALPASITKGSLLYNYQYRATGGKTQTKINNDTYDYIGNAVYLTKGTGSTELEFSGTAEGRWLPKEQLNTYNADKTVNTTPAKYGRFEYNLKDHLGNLRVACRCLETPAATTTQDAAYPLIAVQENHYDAWGADINAWGTDPNDAAKKITLFATPKIPTGSKGITDRFTYNGKELQTDIGLFEYGFRWYDPMNARFTSVDPLANDYAYKTPYDYAENDPINAVDLDGNEKLIVNPRSDNPNSTRFVYPHRNGSVQNRTFISPAREKSNYEINRNNDLKSLYSTSKSLHKIPIVGSYLGGIADEAYLTRKDGRDLVRSVKNGLLPSVGIAIDALTFGEGTIAVKGAIRAAQNESLWLSGVSYGSDKATMLSAENLVPKKGWFDVVIHGDNFYVGNAFNAGKGPISSEELYKMIVADGYEQGTRIRLISCNANCGVAAQQLSNLAEATVIAPNAKTLVNQAGKIITEDGSKYSVIRPQ